MVVLPINLSAGERYCRSKLDSIWRH